jgi:hypothetical protein
MSEVVPKVETIRLVVDTDKETAEAYAQDAVWAVGGDVEVVYYNGSPSGFSRVEFSGTNWPVLRKATRLFMDCFENDTIIMNTY